MSHVILVVDDENTIRTVVRNVLEREGYTVLEARDATQALVMCEAFGSPPDLVLTDIMMPGLSGGELVRELSHGGKPPRVLLMSGYADAELRASLGLAHYPFLQKPFPIGELARKVREVLDQ